MQPVQRFDGCEVVGVLHRVGRVVVSGRVDVIDDYECVGLAVQVQIRSNPSRFNRLRIADGWR